MPEHCKLRVNVGRLNYPLSNLLDMIYSLYQQYHVNLDRRHILQIWSYTRTHIHVYTVIREDVMQMYSYTYIWSIYISSHEIFVPIVLFICMFGNENERGVEGCGFYQTNIWYIIIYANCDISVHEWLWSSLAELQSVPWQTYVISISCFLD